MQNKKQQKGSYFEEQNILGEFPLVYLEKLRTWNSLKHKLALLPLPGEPVSKWCAKVVIIFRCFIHSMSGHMALP